MKCKKCLDSKIVKNPDDSNPQYFVSCTYCDTPHTPSLAEIEAKAGELGIHELIVTTMHKGTRKCLLNLEGGQFTWFEADGAPNTNDLNRRRAMAIMEVE